MSTLEVTKLAITCISIITLALISAHSTLAIDIYGKVLRQVKVHIYESPSCLVVQRS